MINMIRLTKKKLFSYFYTTNKLMELNKKLTIESMQQRERYQKAGNLIPYGYKMYSRNEEDGLIKEIFNRIGVTNKIFIEIGVGDGLENNTLALLFEDWEGLWIEGSQDNVDKIKNGFKKTIEKGLLQVTQSFVTNNNINETISSHLEEKNVDLLSIDIDGNDYHIFNSISCITPRVLVIEYNGKFRPPVMYCMKYDENHIWTGDDNFGASLKFLEVNLKEKGYVLVGCNLTGGNAFFVKEELAKDYFQTPFTAENHYEPTRYELAAHISGHRPCYKTLENRLPTDS